MYTYFPSVSWDSQEKSINIFFHRPGPLRTHCKLQSQMSPDELKRTATPWLMLGTPAQELTATRACRVSQSRVSCFPLINNLEGKARQRLYASLWLETSLDSGPVCVKKSIKASKLKFASTNLIVVQQRTRPIHKNLAVSCTWLKVRNRKERRIFEHVWSYKTTTTLSHTSGSRRICCTTTVSPAALRIQAP